MDIVKYILAIGVAFLNLGCPARSLFPLFTEKDLASLPAITGTWVNGKGETFSFQRVGDKGYDVVLRDENGNTGTYKVQLGRLGKFWFLDSFPGGKGHDHHMIAAHIISKMWLDGDSLRIAFLESDWLKQMIDSGKLNIPHVTLQNEIILTASTEALQQLVLRFADDDNVFPKPEKLVRMK
jgi:hypothetical protein